MKISKNINKFRHVFEFDSLVTAQNFYEKMVEKVDNTLYTEDLPKSFRINIRVDDNKVTMSMNKQLWKLITKEYDD